MHLHVYLKILKNKAKKYENISSKSVSSFEFSFIVAIELYMIYYISYFKIKFYSLEVLRSYSTKIFFLLKYISRYSCTTSIFQDIILLSGS